METEYNRASELEAIFEKYWVPFSKESIGEGESGVELFKMIDKKSNTLYIERYNATTETHSLHSFKQDNHPKTWRLEEDGVKEVIL